MSEHMSLEEYRKIIGAGFDKKSESKYHNQKIEADGHLFDSKAEARRYGELKLLKESGEIRGFGIQPSFLFSSGVRYRPDFIVCGRDGEIWAEDVKSAGTETSTFKLKQKLWESEYPWLELRIVK